jgi:signal transduction histidine kinase
MQVDERVSVGRALLGPWPFVPIAMFLIGVAAFFGRAVLVSGVSAESTGDWVVTLTVLTLLGVAVTSVALVPILVSTGWPRSRRASQSIPTRARYLTVISLTIVVFAIAQVLSRYLTDDIITGQGVFTSIPLSFAINMVLGFVFVLGGANASGYFAFRIGRQARQLRQQVELLQHQRSMIVAADQKARSDVAMALHDDVQAALLRATLRLSRLADATPADEAGGIRAVVADLEHLRGTGVRAIGRRLAPPIESVGLSGALQDIAGTYEGTIDVDVDVAPEVVDVVSAASHHAIAAYRIVEQALLNAAAHGRAQHASVVLRVDDGVLDVVVDDDGLGLPSNVEPGTGSAITDAWVGTIGGTWSTVSRPEGGVRLAAHLPLERAPDDGRAAVGN